MHRKCILFKEMIQLSYTKLLTVQDISCVGQCSLTVALPILSAMGFETCILPTGILSNHTAKAFGGFTFQDTTDYFPAIFDNWKRIGVTFGCIYTGYLGNARQIDALLGGLDLNRGPLVVDPAMADNGVLYTGFDAPFVAQMKKLCDRADILLPNMTEACLLTGTPYKEAWTEDEIRELCRALGHTVILTGVPCGDRIGVAVYKDGDFSVYRHKRIPRSLHGTGDVFSSVFVGEYLNTGDERASAKKAADFTVKCIENTPDDHWYGAAFEPLLKEL